MLPLIIESETETFVIVNILQGEKKLCASFIYLLKIKKPKILFNIGETNLLVSLYSLLSFALKF